MGALGGDCDCFLLNSKEEAVPTPNPQQQKRNSSLPEDLCPPPVLLKATQSILHGNFYTSWQGAQTPGLRKTPNDD